MIVGVIDLTMPLYESSKLREFQGIPHSEAGRARDCIKAARVVLAAQLTGAVALLVRPLPAQSTCATCRFPTDFRRTLPKPRDPGSLERLQHGRSLRELLTCARQELAMAEFGTKPSLALCHPPNGQHD